MPAPALSGGSVDAPFRLTSLLAPLIAIIVGVFMVLLDATAVNVAVPNLVQDFHSTLTTVQWTITGYALAQATVIPVAGWLSDRFGARRIFLLSVVLFTLGSLLCATAPNDRVLIAFRVLQGLGGGCVLPIAMAYVYRLSPPERVGAVMGILGIPILLAPAIGPVLAGWLVQYETWRWIFLLNLPVGIAGIVLGLRYLPQVQRQTVAGLDLPGMLLGPLAFASLSYGISEGGTSWSSINTIGGLSVGSVALVAFVVAELRSRTPLLELRVFRSVHFSLGIVLQSVAQFALFGVLFLVPLFLQQARGFGAFDTGLIILPQALAAAVAMPIGGTLFDRIGARPLAIIGLSLVAAGTFILSHLSPATQGVDLILPLALAGAGTGLMLMPLNTHLMSIAPRQLVSRVTSLNNALQQVINSLTVAVLATVLSSRIHTHVAGALVHVHVPGAAVLQALLARAAAAGFDDTFRIILAASVAGAAACFLLINPARAVTTGDVGEDDEEDALLPALSA